MKLEHIVIITIFSVFLLSNTLALTYTNKARPLINVTFEEPVTVTKVSLNDDTGILELVANEGNKEYIYKPKRDLTEGIYIISITAKDVIGNIATFSEIFTADLTPPEITVSIGEHQVIRESRVPIEIILSEPANTTYIELNKAAITDKFLTSDNIKYKATLTIEDGDSMLYVFVTDHAENSDTLLRTFTVITRPVDIRLIEPPFGVSQTQPFDVVFGTNRWAKCKYSLEAGLNYSSMTKATHTTNFTQHNVAHIPSATTLYIACEDQFGITEGNTASFQLTVDWDDPVIMSAYAEPSVVEEEPETTFYVKTNEPTRCRYSSSKVVFEEMLPFYEGSVFNTTNKVTIMTPNQNQEYTYYVQCEDKSFRRTEAKGITFQVYLGFPLEIRDHTNEAFTTTTPLLNFSTNKRAQCYYSDNHLQPTRYSLGQGTAFAKLLYLTPGSFTYYLYCYRPTNIEEYDKETVSFVIDTTAPVMRYVDDSNPELPSNQDYTFRTDRLYGRWKAEDNETGISEYEVKVFLDGFITKKMIYNSTYQTEDAWIRVRLNDTKKYFIEVRAQNGIGRWGIELQSDGITVDTSQLPEWCKNEVKDHDETDVDCGGQTCFKCDTGKRCLASSDCKTDYCNSSLRCDTIRCNLNGLAEPGEACDGVDLRGVKCQDFDDFNGGLLQCNDHCDFDTSLCAVCDLDGVAELGEACDGSDLGGMSCVDFGFTSGVLVCTGECEFDSSGCEVLVCDYDGVREFGEACDCGGAICSAEQLDYMSCTDFDRYIGGSLSCNARCDYDTSSCLVCDSDGQAELGEACDGSDLRGKTCEAFEGYIGGVLACHGDCRFDFSRCLRHDCDHDGRAELGEACDGADLRGQGCQDFEGFTGGTLECNDDCEFSTDGCVYCDNDDAADPGEACDGFDLRGKACEDFAGFNGGTLSCTADCEYDTSACVVCDNDGRAELGEACDGTDLRSKTCDDFEGFNGGKLRCENCEYVTGECELVVQEGCDNDGQAELGEACDGTDLRDKSCEDFDDFNGGTLRCGENCEFDTSSCVVCDNDGQAELGEACDGSDLGGMSCVDFGFTSGVLVCTGECEFDSSGCEVLVCDYDGVREFGEACDCGSGSCSDAQLDYTSCTDFGYRGGRLGCSYRCDFDTDFCFVCDNDDIADFGEACDGSDLRGKTCEGFEGYIGGVLACHGDCRFDFSRCLRHECDSDGVADFGEACDGFDLRGLSCLDFGGFTGGVLTCNDECEYDTLGCSYCNENDIVEPGEACDGFDLRGLKCSDFDQFVAGVLGCVDCGFDTRACKVGLCDMDGVADVGEACDGSDFRGKTCEDFEFSGGVLVCDGDCEFDTSGCVICDNDGQAELGEACDGNDLRDKRCEDFGGFIGGQLGCSDCEYVTDDCETAVQEGCDSDGLRETGEACDCSSDSCSAGQLDYKSCSDFDEFTGGALGCSLCEFDTSDCVVCDGDGIAEIGEACDGTDLRGQSCTNFGGFTDGDLSCTVSCEFDTSDCEVATEAECDNDGIAELGEACDGSDLRYKSCNYFDEFNGGTLKCDEDCEYDTGLCVVCDNDGIAELGEACDTSDLRAKECADFGLSGGTLACSSACEYEFEYCTDYDCDNDGIAESGELCDGSDLKGESCADFEGFVGGSLKCTDICEFDTSACVFCDKDNLAETGEACDGTDLREIRCEDFGGFTGGDLGCVDCDFATDNCEVAGRAGCDNDGVAELDESCDGSDLDEKTCSDFEGFNGGVLACSEDCQFDTSGCVVCDYDDAAELGEACDGGDLNGKICSDFDDFAGGTLACSRCEFVTDDCYVGAEGSCADEIKNGDETDIDCGGSCPPCPSKKECRVDSDCESGVCDTSTGKCSTEHCMNEQWDPPMETDVDCGGVCPRECTLGQQCEFDDDCEQGARCIDSVCTVCEHNDLDCDGIPNDQDPDIDGDGIPNDQDPDDDNDGLCDTLESQLNQEGICTGDDDDDDGDSLPDPDDIDSDNDLDNDGVINELDDDMDGDGIINMEDPDNDNDGLSNEQDNDDDNDGTPDNMEDSDSDGMPDGWETQHGLDPFDASDAAGDLDEDGLSNREEYDYGTNPLDPDTDGDGWTDLKEINKGTDPLDPDEHPRSAWLTILLILIILGLFGVGGYFGYRKYQEYEAQHKGATPRQFLMNKVMQARPMRPIVRRFRRGRLRPVYREREKLRSQAFEAFGEQKKTEQRQEPSAETKEETPKKEEQKALKKEDWVPLDSLQKKSRQTKEVFKKLEKMKAGKGEDAFERLKFMSKGKTDVLQRLRTLSAATKTDKKNLVGTLSKIHQTQPLTKDHVHEVLSHLIKRQKLGKKDVPTVVNGLKSKNVLSEKDAASVKRRLK